MSDRKALAREIAARTTPRFIEIKEEKRDRRPIILWPDDVRRAEKVRKRLARLLKSSCPLPRSLLVAWLGPFLKQL